MFVEKRKQGRSINYYLVHSYRVGTSVKRISRYLGSNLDAKTLEKLRIGAEKIILEQVNKSPYETELDIASIKKFKEYDIKLDIVHLQKVDWDRFTKEFTYNTNAIEGSTVALKEVEDLVERREKPQNYDELETINVAKAVEYIRTTKDVFSIELMLKLHQLCFEGTKSFAGKLRNVDVVIRDGAGNIVHQGASYHIVTKLLKQLVKWYIAHKHKYPPLLLAALTHNEFENIHPFQDGNGRVGRLLLNYVLLKHNYPPVNITLKDRKKYYQVLQDYEKTGDIKSTLKFLISQYKVSTKSKK
ncbi:MAG: Fic family protein [Candidatus Woesearchaeota archaeon]